MHCITIVSGALETTTAPPPFFDVLLTVHLSIVLAINQLNAQNLLL